MSQDQQRDRLRQLRAARNESLTRLEAVRDSSQAGGWAGAPNQAFAARSRGHGGTFIGLLLLAIIGGGVLAGGGYLLHAIHSSPGGPVKQVAFVVQQGEDLTSVSNHLESDHLVTWGWLFKFYYSYLRSGSGDLQAGTHNLNTGMSMDQIAQNLDTRPIVVVTPVPTKYQYNFLAGKRAEEIATILQDDGVTTYDAFMNEVLHGSFSYWFLQSLPSGAGLEGFLAPGEYILTPNMSAHAVVDMMLKRFGDQFTPAMVAEAQKAHRSIFDVVTLASIVQRESSLPKVQRAIAGVLYNRLQNSTVVSNELQADPTVQYALGYDAAQKTWWRSGLTTQDYSSVQSPYNTYINPGLPPGPISSPGLPALNAALDPLKSDWLFYQASGPANGRQTTYFCATYQCQLAGAGVPVQ